MNKQIIFAVVLGSLLIAANAAYDVETGSYTQVPVKVLNADADKNFQIPFVGRYVNGSYFTLWGLYGDGQKPATYNAVRRLLNATTLTSVGNDTNANLSVLLSSAPVLASSTHGYLGVAGTVLTKTTTTTGNTSASASTNGTETNVTANATQTTTTTTTTLSVTADVFISTLDYTQNVHVVLDSTTNETAGFNVYQHWFLDDYFYVLYSSTHNGVDQALFLQGYSVSGSLKFTDPLQINTQNLSGNAAPQAGQLGDSVVVAWRRNSQNQVVYTTVDVGAATVGDETVIATDSGATQFNAAAVVFSTNYYVILLSKSTGGLSTGITISLSGNNVTAALNFALTTSYNTFDVAASAAYYDGWFIVAHQERVTVNTVTGSEDSLQLYNYTQTKGNSTNKTDLDLLLTTDGTVAQGFTSPNQSYYVLIFDSATGDKGSWKNGYIGQVFGKINDSTFGAALKVAFTFVSAILAMMFVF